MLVFLAQLMISNPEACVPEISEPMLQSVFPQSGAMDVAIDSVIRLEFSGYFGAELPEFNLSHDGEELDVEVELIVENHHFNASQSIVEIRTVDDLVAKEEFLLEMDGESILLFRSSTQLTAPIQTVPEFGWIDQYFVDNTVYSEIDSCTPDTETEIWMDVGEREKDAALILFRVERDGQAMDEEAEPFFLSLDSTETNFSFTIPYTEESEEFCFTAAFVNSAGEMGELSEVQCSYQYEYGDFRCGTGLQMFACSSMPAENLGLMGLTIGLLGLSRRRED